MNKIFALLPKRVMIAAIVAAVTIVVGAVLVPTLGSARDEAVALGARLTSEIAQNEARLVQLRADHLFATENLAKYEALMNSDKLVPHTRRAAVVALQEAASAHGLTSMTYNFDAAKPTSLKSVESQSRAGGYTVGVETIGLRVGGPIDGPLYRFVEDVMQTFPGSLILENMSLSRPGDITPLALAAVSAGKDSGLVQGEIGFSWRTAQAEKTATEKAK